MADHAPGDKIGGPFSLNPTTMPGEDEADLARRHHPDADGKAVTLPIADC